MSLVVIIITLQVDVLFHLHIILMAPLRRLQGEVVPFNLGVVYLHTGMASASQVQGMKLSVQL